MPRKHNLHTAWDPQSYSSQVPENSNQFENFLVLGRLGGHTSTEDFCNFATVFYFWGCFYHIFMVLKSLLKASLVSERTIFL